MKPFIALLCILCLASPAMATEVFTAKDFVEASTEDRWEITEPVTTEVNVLINADGTVNISFTNTDLTPEQVKDIECQINEAMCSDKTKCSKLCELGCKVKAVIVKTGQTVKVVAIEVSKGVSAVCVAVLPVAQFAAAMISFIFTLLL